MSNNRGILILACACAALASVTEPAKGDCPRAVPSPGVAASTGPALELFGTISQVQGDHLIVETRAGKLVTIDATPALNAKESTPLIDGRQWTSSARSDRARWCARMSSVTPRTPRPVGVRTAWRPSNRHPPGSLYGVDLLQS